MNTLFWMKLATLDFMIKRILKDVIFFRFLSLSTMIVAFDQDSDHLFIYLTTLNFNAFSYSPILLT